LVRITGDIMQAAEAAWIVEPQQAPGIQQHVDMVVDPSRRIAGEHPQAARHAQMQQQGAGLEFEQKVLGAALGMQDAQPGDTRRQVLLHAPAQARLVDVKGDDAPADCVRLDAPSGGLYFGKLGHTLTFEDRPRSAWLLDLGFLVGDVLAGDRVELAHFHLVRMQPLVLGGDVEMAGSCGGQELDFLAHGILRESLSGPRRQTLTPWARNSATTWSMPFFSIVRSPWVEMRRDTQRFSASSQN